MATDRDYYEILGVSRSASQDEIKLAYRNLARQHHPDLAKENKKEAEDHFKEINEAFEVLSSPDKRAQYDRFGHAGVRNSGGFREGFSGFAGFDIFDDLFETFFGGESAERHRGPGGARQRRRPRGRDIRADVEIALEEAMTGVSKEISFHGFVRCEDCNGTGGKGEGAVETCRPCRGTGEVQEVVTSFFGQIIRSGVCPACRGQGEILRNLCPTCRGRGIHEAKRKMQVEIPAGIEHGTRIRYRNEGEPGERRGPAGDLYLFVHLKEDPRFRREGNDIVYPVHLSFPELVLGTELEIPTLHGPEILRIPAGTQAGATFRLRGKGMPSLNGHGMGDQIVVVQVDIPKHLSEKQRQLLLEYAKQSGVKVKEDKGFFGRVKDAFS